MRRQKIGRVAFMLSRAITLIFLLVVSSAEGAVIFSRSAESGTCDTSVATGVWNGTGSGNFPNSQVYYRCATPPSGFSLTKYFAIDNTVNLQHDGYNTTSISSATLTSGTEYFMTLLVRYDKVSGADYYRDTGSAPDSYDKAYEFTNASLRFMLSVGLPDWANCATISCDGQFTFGVYIGTIDGQCNGCTYEQMWPCIDTATNCQSYTASKQNFTRYDYGRWHSIVIGITPSTTTANQIAGDGRIRMWVNGVLKYDWTNMKTQNAANPTVDSIANNGTWSQPAYDSPQRNLKFAEMQLVSSITDIDGTGGTRNFFADPEPAGGGGGGGGSSLGHIHGGGRIPGRRR